MQVEVEILVQTITQQYGALSQGDILRTSREFAAHLVDDCGAAKYKSGPATAPQAAEAQPDTAPVTAELPTTAAKPKKK